MKRKKIRIVKKKLARSILLLLVISALIFVMPNIIKTSKAKGYEPNVNEAEHMDLKQFPQLCEFLTANNINSEKILNISLVPKNITSNKAVYGSVLYFEAKIEYDDDETAKQFVTQSEISFNDSAGLDTPNSEAIMMSETGEHVIGLKFFDYETSFTVNIINQEVTEEKQRLINKYARVSQDYTAGSIVTDYNVNFVYGTDDEVSQMEEEALSALAEMLNAASDAGYNIYALSGYRSYELQSYLYERAGGDSQNTTAPPGGSEHQSGLAMDMTWGENYYSLSEEQEYTDEFDWLTQNCAKYGFILRYTKGYEDITGYIYEPWHFRYLGKNLAQEYYASGAHTLEEFMAEPR